jgi:hypothetical protein
MRLPPLRHPSQSVRPALWAKGVRHHPQCPADAAHRCGWICHRGQGYDISPHSRPVSAVPVRGPCLAGLRPATTTSKVCHDQQQLTPCIAPPRRHLQQRSATTACRDPSHTSRTIANASFRLAARRDGQRPRGVGVSFGSGPSRYTAYGSTQFGFEHFAQQGGLRQRVDEPN